MWYVVCNGPHNVPLKRSGVKFNIAKGNHSIVISCAWWDFGIDPSAIVPHLPMAAPFAMHP